MATAKQGSHPAFYALIVALIVMSLGPDISDVIYLF